MSLHNLAAPVVVLVAMTLFGTLSSITATSASATATMTCSTTKGVETCKSIEVIAVSKAIDTESNSVHVVSTGKNVLENTFYVFNQAKAEKQGNCFWVPKAWAGGYNINNGHLGYELQNNLHVCKTSASPTGLAKIGGGKDGLDCRNPVRLISSPPPPNEQFTNVRFVNSATYSATVNAVSTSTATASASVSVHTTDGTCRAIAKANAHGFGKGTAHASGEGSSATKATQKAKSNLVKSLTQANLKAQAKAAVDASSHAFTYASAEASCSGSSTSITPVKTTTKAPLYPVGIVKNILLANGKVDSNFPSNTFSFWVTIVSPGGKSQVSHKVTLQSANKQFGSYPSGTYVTTEELTPSGSQKWAIVLPKKGNSESTTVGKQPYLFVYTDQQVSTPPPPTTSTTTTTTTTTTTIPPPVKQPVPPSIVFEETPPGLEAPPGGDSQRICVDVTAPNGDAVLPPVFQITLIQGTDPGSFAADTQPNPVTQPYRYCAVYTAPETPATVSIWSTVVDTVTGLQASVSFPEPWVIAAPPPM